MSDVQQRSPSPAFVGPWTFLHPEQKRSPPEPVDIVDKEQAEGLVSNSEMCARGIETDELQHAIREFLKVRTTYDVLPVSFRLVILDTSLLVKKSLNILVHNGKILTRQGKGELQGN